MGEVSASGEGRSSTQARERTRKLIIDLSIMTVVGIVLALIGPFGSFAEPLPVRLVSWLGFSYIGYAIYSPMGLLVDRLHRALDLPRFGLWVAACLLASVPMSAVVWAMRFLPERVALPDAEQAFGTYFSVLVIGSGVTALFNALVTNKAKGAGDSAVADPVTDYGEIPVELAPAKAATPFLDRLPPELGSDLIALEMEDHYVRAHTALGSDLILMRMRDAVAELNGLEGAQVHRSWWVARHAVEDVRREGRNIRLALPRELEAPVSRAMAPQLKQEGWW